MTSLFNRHGVERKPNAGTPDKPLFAYRQRCGRCGGAGGSAAWSHTGYTCYDCAGSGLGGTVYDRLYTAEQNARLDATAAKRAEKAAAKRAAELAKLESERAARRDAFKAANADTLAKVLELSRAAREDDTFWSNLYNEWIHVANELSEAQVKMVDDRHAQLLERQAVAKRQSAAGHVGDVGKRVKAKARVTRVVELGLTQFYPQQMRYLVALETEAGHALAWFTTSFEQPHDEFVDCAFTVKEHGEYKGLPQTIVQRVKFTETQPA